MPQPPQFLQPNNNPTPILPELPVLPELPEIQEQYPDKTPELKTESREKDPFSTAFFNKEPDVIFSPTPFDTERYDKGESLVFGENQGVLEDVYAQRQGLFTQLANGIIKSLPNVAGSFVGSFTAIPEMLAGADYGASTGFADSWLKSWENAFPNYKTTYEQNNPMSSWLYPIYWGNKIGDGLIKNIGFTVGTIGGMLAQDAIIGTLTGGTGVAPLATMQLGKAANAVGRLFATGQKLDKLTDLARTQKSLYDTVMNLSTGAKITSLAQYGLLSSAAAMSEAGMEAYHVNEDVKKALIEETKAAKGEVTSEDLQRINQLAKEAATTTYGWNLPVILASNAIMLGDFFSNKGVSDLTKEVLENTTLQGGKWTVRTLSKGAKMQEYLKNFSVPFLTEGFWEEGNQTIISEYSKHRAEAQFKGKNPEEFTSFYLNQMLTPEYQESVLLGGLTGMVISGAQGAYNKYKGNTITEKQKTILESLNKEDLFKNTVKAFADSINNKEFVELAPDLFSQKNEEILNMADTVANLQATGRYEAFRDRIEALKEMPDSEVAQLGIEKKDIDSVTEKLDMISTLSQGVQKLRNPVQNPTESQQKAFNLFKQTVLRQVVLFDSFKGRTASLKEDLSKHFDFEIIDALIAPNNKEVIVDTITKSIESLKIELEGLKAVGGNSIEIKEIENRLKRLNKVLSHTNFRDDKSVLENVIKPLIKDSPYTTTITEGSQTEFLNNVYQSLKDLKMMSNNLNPENLLNEKTAQEFIDKYTPAIEVRDRVEEINTPVTPVAPVTTPTTPITSVSTPIIPAPVNTPVSTPTTNTVTPIVPVEPIVYETEENSSEEEVEKTTTETPIIEEEVSEKVVDTFEDKRSDMQREIEEKATGLKSARKGDKGIFWTQFKGNRQDNEEDREVEVIAVSKFGVKFKGEKDWTNFESYFYFKNITRQKEIEDKYNLELSELENTAQQKTYSPAVQATIDIINKGVSKELVLSSSGKTYIESGVEEDGTEETWRRVSELKPPFKGVKGDSSEAVDRGTVLDNLFRAYVDGMRDEAAFLEHYKTLDKGQSDGMTQDFLKDVFSIYKDVVEALADYELIPYQRPLYGVINGKNTAGSVDILAIHKVTGKPLIIDLKSSTHDRTDINDNLYEKNKLNDTIQLSAYQDLFEQRTGLEADLMIFPLMTVKGQGTYKSAKRGNPLLVELKADRSTYEEITSKEEETKPIEPTESIGQETQEEVQEQEEEAQEDGVATEDDLRKDSETVEIEPEIPIGKWVNRVSYLGVAEEKEEGEKRVIDANYETNYDVIHSIKEGDKLEFRLREGKTDEGVDGIVIMNPDTKEESVTTNRLDQDAIIDIYYKNTRIGAVPRVPGKKLKPERADAERKELKVQRTQILEALNRGETVTSTVTKLNKPRLVKGVVTGIPADFVEDFFSNISIISKETNLQSIYHYKGTPRAGGVITTIEILEAGVVKELTVLLASGILSNNDGLLDKLYDSLIGISLGKDLSIADFIFMNRERGLDYKKVGKQELLYVRDIEQEVIDKLLTIVDQATAQNIFYESGGLLGIDFAVVRQINKPELNELLRSTVTKALKDRYFNFNKRKAANKDYRNLIVEYSLLLTNLDPFKTKTTTRFAAHPDIFYNPPAGESNKITTQEVKGSGKPPRRPSGTGAIRKQLPVLTKTNLQKALETKYNVPYQEVNTFKESLLYFVQKGMDYSELNENNEYEDYHVEINSPAEIESVLDKIILYNEEQATAAREDNDEQEAEVFAYRALTLNRLKPFIKELYYEAKSETETTSKFEYEEDRDVSGLEGDVISENEQAVRDQYAENANFTENHYQSLPKEIRSFLLTLPKIASIENDEFVYYTNSLGFKQLLNPYDVFDKMLNIMSKLQIEKDLNQDLKNQIIRELEQSPSVDLKYIGNYLRNSNITNEFWAKLLNVAQNYKAQYVQAFVDDNGEIAVYSSTKNQAVGNQLSELLNLYKTNFEILIFNARGEVTGFSVAKLDALIKDLQELQDTKSNFDNRFEELEILKRFGFENENADVAKRIFDNMKEASVKAGGTTRPLLKHFVQIFKEQLTELKEVYNSYEPAVSTKENDETLLSLLEDKSPFVSEQKIIKEMAEIYYTHLNTQETGVVRSGGKNYYPYIKPSYKTRLMKAFSDIRVGLANQHRALKDWSKDAIKSATLIAQNRRKEFYLDKFSHEYTLGAVSDESDSVAMKKLTDTDRLLIELATYIGNQTNPRLLHDTNEAKPIFELTQMFKGSYVIQDLEVINGEVQPKLDDGLLDEYMIKLYAENRRIIHTHTISKEALEDTALARLLMPGIHNTVTYENGLMKVREGNATRHFLFPWLSREMLDDMSKGDDIYGALRDFIYRKTTNVNNTNLEQYEERVWQPIDIEARGNDTITFAGTTMKLKDALAQLMQEDFLRDLERQKEEFIKEGIFAGQTFTGKTFNRLFSKKSYARKFKDSSLVDNATKSMLRDIADGKYAVSGYETAETDTNRSLHSVMKFLSTYFLTEYTAYTRLHSLEMLMMTGDPALFDKGNLNAYDKSLTESQNAINNYVKTFGAISTELAKRNASLNASGTEGTIYWQDKTTRVIKATDFKVNSPLFETISNLIGADAAKSYKTGDKTDAMKISTIKSVLEKEFMQGTLTENEFLNLFQQLAPEQYQRTVEKNPGYFNMFLGNYNERNLNKGLKKVLKYEHGKPLYVKAFNPIKNVGRGHSYDPKLQAIFEHYVKDADLPLTRNTVGGQFNELIKFMEDNDIDSVVFNTAVKQYKTKPSDLFIKEKVGELEVEILNKGILDEVITLPFDSFRQQLATPFEQSKHKVAESTQQIAILVADMPFDYPIGGGTKNFKEAYFEKHQELFKDALSDLSAEMGIIFTYENGEISLEWENLDKLSKYLIRQVKLQNLDSSLIEALKLNSEGEFTIPLTYTLGNKSLQPVILAEFTKHAVKKKIHGKPYFQATEGILQTLKTLNETFSFERDGKTYTNKDFNVTDATQASMKTTKEFAQGDGKLKGLRLKRNGVEITDQKIITEYREALDSLENNDLLYTTESEYKKVKAKRDKAIAIVNSFEVLPMEIIIGFNFLDENGFRLNLDDFLTPEGYIDETKIDPKLLELNGFRIPYQGKSSGSWFKIVGFLPHHNADTAIVPAEIIAQMGSDFDIDKLYTYAYNYLLHDGKLKLYTEEAVNEFNQSVRDLKQDELDKFKDLKKLWKEYTELDKKEDSEAPIALESFVEIIENNYTFEAYDEIMEAGNRYKALFKFLREKGILKKEKGFVRRKSLENDLLDLHKQVYLSPFYYRDIVRPLETPNSDAAIEKLEEARKKYKATTGYKVNNIYNRSTQRSILKDNVLGQTALGVFVTNSLIHTVFQETGAYFTYPLLLKKGGVILRDSNGYKQSLFSDKVGDEEIVFARENAVDKDGKIKYKVLEGLRRIDRLFTLNTSFKVSTIFNELIGISVDNPKDKKLAKLGINNENMNIYASLIRLLPVDDVTVLMNQPILDAFFRKVESFNSMFYDEFQRDKVTEAARKLLEETIKQFDLKMQVSNEDNPNVFTFTQGGEKVVPIVDLDLLEKSLAQPDITKDNALQQVFLLAQIFTFRAQANNVRDMISTMDTYRNGIKPTFVENNIVANKIDEVFDNTLVKNVGRTFSQTIPYITLGVPRAVADLFTDRVFAFGSRAYTSIYDRIGAQSKFRVETQSGVSHKLNAKELNNINNEFQRYLMTNPELLKNIVDFTGIQLVSNLGSLYTYDPSKNLVESIDDFIFNGEESIFNLMKATKAKGSNFDNLFVLKLSTISKKNNGLQIKSVNRDLYEKVKKDWLRLFSFSEESVEFKLAHKALLYAFMYGNKIYGDSSILRYVPEEVLNAINYGEIMNGINKALNTPDHTSFTDSFIESFIQNNPKVLTKVPSKELKVKGDYVTTDNMGVINKDYFYTVRYDKKTNRPYTTLYKRVDEERFAKLDQVDFYRYGTATEKLQRSSNDFRYGVYFGTESFVPRNHIMSLLDLVGNITKSGGEKDKYTKAMLESMTPALRDLGDIQVVFDTSSYYNVDTGVIHIQHDQVIEDVLKDLVHEVGHYLTEAKLKEEEAKLEDERSQEYKDLVAAYEQFRKNIVSMRGQDDISKVNFADIEQAIYQTITTKYGTDPDLLDKFLNTNELNKKFGANLKKITGSSMPAERVKAIKEVLKERGINARELNTVYYPYGDLKEFISRVADGSLLPTLMQKEMKQSENAPGLFARMISGLSRLFTHLQKFFMYAAGIKKSDLNNYNNSLAKEAVVSVFNFARLVDADMESKNMKFDPNLGIQGYYKKVFDILFKREVKEKEVDVKVETKENKVVGINIRTDKSNPNSIGNRLTNPNWYSKGLMDVEGPYKANASKIKAPNLNPEEALRFDMNLMYKLQVQKLEKNPELIDEINENGGLEFLLNSSHIVGTKNSRWEGVGIESNFIKVLVQSYTTVAKKLNKYKEKPEDKTETKENKVALKVMSKVPQAEKDKAPFKAKNSIGFIGFGKEGSSTKYYEDQYKEIGLPVNPPAYLKDKVYFASVNGDGFNRDTTLKEVVKALEQGAKVLLDSKKYIDSSKYNKEGEGWLYNELNKLGYKQQAVSNENTTMWYKETNQTKTNIKNEDWEGMENFFNEQLDNIIEQKKVLPSKEAFKKLMC